MGRRYRNSNNLASVVLDVVKMSVRSTWWGALLIGVIFYFVIAVLFISFIDSQLAKLDGNPYALAATFRLDRLRYVCIWVGNSCFVAGFLVSLFKVLFDHSPSKLGKGLTASFSKLFGRWLD